jgi:hypothetical protein
MRNSDLIPLKSVYDSVMFFGTHLLLYSHDAEADRAFLRDVLEIPAVDAGEGWLIFTMPPAEMGVHPGEAQIEHAGANLAAGTVYLMCRDLSATMSKLETRGVHCTPVQEAGWGVVTSIPLPGGSSLGLYQPRHPLAIQTP